MARPLRFVRPGAWYHITARGIERRPIFRDARDNAHFLDLMAELPERFGLRLHAYALMGNHYHLLVELGQANLSRAIQWLNLSHSAWFNRRHRRCGYLFQGRFKSILVDPVSWGLALSAYIHLNPVRTARLALGKTDRQRARAGAGELPSAEIVRQRIKILRDYPWTSYRAYIGLMTPAPWLCSDEILRLGGSTTKNRRAAYQKYVENQLRHGRMEPPWDQVIDGLFLGVAQFVQTLKNEARKKIPSPQTPRWLRKPIPLSEVIAAVERSKGEKWIDFKDRHGDTGSAALLYLARRTTQLTLRELAAELGIKRPANITMTIKRYETQLSHNPARARQLAKAAKMLNVAL